MKLIRALSGWVLKAAEDGGCTTSLGLCLVIFVVTLFPLYHQNNFFQLVPAVSLFPVVHHDRLYCLASLSVLCSGELLLGPSQSFLFYFFFPNPANQNTSVSFQRTCGVVHYFYFIIINLLVLEGPVLVAVGTD